MIRFLASTRLVHILLAVSFLVATAGLQSPSNVLGQYFPPNSDQPDSTPEYPAFSFIFELPDEQPSFWVVKAFFSDRQMVDELAAWVAPWEVNHDEGYLVVDVSMDEISLMEQAGFVVEIDYELTQHLNTPNIPLPGQISGIPGYPCYRTVEETYTSAEQIAAEYPHLASWIKIGESWEKIFGSQPGYDMMVLRLTNSEIDIPKPSLFIMASMHAREYTPAELATRFAELLVANYSSNADITWLLDYNEIHLLLQANPDGRKWAESGYYWRKNTNNNFCGGTTSRGVDLNRNYPYLWGCCNGSSDVECDQTFRGTNGNSEPETYAVNNYLVEIFPDQRDDDPNSPAPEDATGVFLDLHSYSNLVLWPWGWTYTSPPNGTALQTLGRKFAYFNNYTPYQSPNLYITDGTTIDTAYGHLGLAAYTFELGTWFFQECSYFENTIIPGNMPALIYAAKVARTPYLTPSGPDAINLTLSEQQVERGEPVTLTAVLDDTRFKNSQGYEPIQNIAAAEVYINVPPWLEDENPQPIPMQPLDGQFNSPVENATVTLETSDLEPGQHILFVRGQDTNENWGAVSAVFLEVFASELEHSKTASHAQAFAGEVIDYSVSQSLFYFEGIPTTQTITDSLPAELIVLTETINLNGEPAPDLYDADTHQIVYEWSGMPESNQNTFTINYQVQVDSQIDQMIEIYNTLESVADVDGEALPAPEPILLNLVVYPSPLLTHMKTATESEGIPAEIIDFTLTQELNLPGEFSVTHSLVDILPEELILLVDSVQLNGQAAPELYDPAQHSLVFDHTEIYAGVTEISITYQAQIDPEISETSEIENTLQSQAQIGDYILQIPDPAIFNLNVLEAPQLAHTKEASLSQAAPGEIITYTLTLELVLPKEDFVTLSLLDTLPPELIVLTETIQLNGEAAPQLYDPGEHTIGISQNETYAGTLEVTIIYQARISEDTDIDLVLENMLASQANVAAVEVSPPQPVIASVLVTPIMWHFYIPITTKN